MRSHEYRSLAHLKCSYKWRRGSGDITVSIKEHRGFPESSEGDVVAAGKDETWIWTCRAKVYLTTVFHMSECEGPQIF